MSEFQFRQINLSAGDNPKFDKSVFDRAMAWLHENKGVEPSELIKGAPRELIDEINRILSGAVDKGIAAASLKYQLPTDVISALRENTFVFSGMKTYHELKQASQLLINDSGEVKSFEAFKTDVQQIYEDYNVNYLNTEYNFANASAQTAARWQDFEKDGSRYLLQFRTAGDSKVRADHEELNNTTLPLDDPFWNDYVPPLDWNCRCMVIQVGSEEKPSDSAEAIKLGEAATTNVVNGVNKSAMFRFNPGKTLEIFPDKHPYMARASSPEDVKAVQRIISHVQNETWETIETENGVLRISSLHGISERADNINIATHYANKYGHEIDLLGRIEGKKTADALNKTLGYEQEYKTNRKPTKSAIDNEIRDASKQAKNIVIRIDSKISIENLERGIKGRVNQEPNIESVSILKKNNDKLYTREQILSRDFKL